MIRTSFRPKNSDSNEEIASLKEEVRLLASRVEILENIND
jgi:hypothetical protein